ncbi:P-loop containing nucleoside triphosphate hydrolase protein [Scenedesmus sp. NREL 46B-D3]|nr:P-loop containing nucleoside triphosphate hydrolase protein [Scenedesmus sp. NREL 46B-D3]
MASTSSNVRVLARVRPAQTHEYQYDVAAEVLSATCIRLSSSDTNHSYESAYDCVLPDSFSQEQMYHQTGSGKTFTMIADQAMTLADALSIPSSSSGHGIVPRAVHELFQALGQRCSSARAPGAAAAAGAAAGGAAALAGTAAATTEEPGEAKLVLSYLEIYDDRLYDLLQPYKPNSNSSRDPCRLAAGKTSLEIREDVLAGTHVPNLLYVDVQNCRQVLQLVAAGNRNRATAHTDRNQNSSRSHAILQFWLEQRPAAADAAAGGTVTRSKLNFVDLAGSERVSQLTSINNSLSALAHVVAALTDRSAKHVPYRSSRLTHLLQDSLGGNCNTTLIVTLAPCAGKHLSQQRVPYNVLAHCPPPAMHENLYAFSESLATLRFADRARNVANRAMVNSSHDADTILAIKEREIQRLRALLATYASTGSAASSPNASLNSSMTQQRRWQEWAVADDGGKLRQQQAGEAHVRPEYSLCASQLSWHPG